MGLSQPKVILGHPLSSFGHGIELLLCVAAQVRALGKVLAQQSIGVFVTTPLLMTVGVAEINLHVRIRTELSMLGHLAPPIMGQSLMHDGLGNAAEFVAEHLQHSAAVAGLGCGSLACTTRCVVRSTSVLASFVPLTRSPFQWSRDCA